MPGQGYGLPLRCPKCSRTRLKPVIRKGVLVALVEVRTDYFGMLKHPGVKAVPCPNCGSSLKIVRRD